LAFRGVPAYCGFKLIAKPHQLVHFFDNAMLLRKPRYWDEHVPQLGAVYIRLPALLA
jgi:hypothetical protein